MLGKFPLLWVGIWQPTRPRGPCRSPKLAGVRPLNSIPPCYPVKHVGRLVLPHGGLYLYLYHGMRAALSGSFRFCSCRGVRLQCKSQLRGSGYERSTHFTSVG